MKRLRLLGLMLMAVFAIGAAAAATASAVEPGVLTLKEVAELKILQEEKNESLGNIAILTAGESKIECKKLWVLPITLAPGPIHWDLIKDLDLHFTECTSLGVKCKSAADVNGTILVLLDVHLVAFLVGKLLVPGVIFLILNEQLLHVPIVLTCGIIKVEVKGTAPAKAVQLNEKLEASKEGEESKRFTIAAEPGLECDETDLLCKKLFAPLEANFGGGFKAATEKTEAQKMAFSEDVTWDF